MTRAERVVDAVTHSDRPVSISMRGTNQIVASSKSITLFFDDESYVSFRTPNYDKSLRLLAQTPEKHITV